MIFYYSKLIRGGTEIAAHSSSELQNAKDVLQETLINFGVKYSRKDSKPVKTTGKGLEKEYFYKLGEFELVTNFIWR